MKREKRFIKGNTYVFSTKKYKKEERQKVKKDSWITDCNGMEVSFSKEEEGVIWFRSRNSSIFIDYWVEPKWCKCIKQGNQK